MKSALELSIETGVISHLELDLVLASEPGQRWITIEGQHLLVRDDGSFVNDPPAWLRGEKKQVSGKKQAKSKKEKAVDKNDVPVTTVKAFHTSVDPIKKLKSGSAMWVTEDKKLADAYHENIKFDTDTAHTYEVTAKGKFLSSEQFSEELEKLGVDEADLVAELVSNPRDILKNDVVKQLATRFDGVRHREYDPRDNQKDVESLLVFNPAKSLQIKKQVR